MEPKRISLLAFGVLTLAVMIFNIPVNPIREANALNVQTISTGATNASYTTTLTTNIASFGNVQWNLYEEITNQTLLTINATNGVLVQSLSLSTSIGGNHKVASGITCQSTGAGGAGWCIVVYSGGTGVDRAFLIDITNGVAPGNTGAGVSYSNALLFSRAVMSGFDQVAGTIHIMWWDSGGTNKIFYDSWSVPYNTVLVNGVPVNTTPKVGNPFVAVSHVDTGYVGSNPYDLFYARVFNATTGQGINEIGWTLAGGTNFALFNVGAQVQKCSANTAQQGFQVVYKQLASGVQQWYVSSSVGGWIKVYDNSCNLITTLTITTYDSPSANVRSEAISALRNEIYMYANTGNVLVINATSPFSFITKVGIASDAGGTTRFAEMLANQDNSVIFSGDLGVANSNTNKYQIIYWNNIGGTGTGGTPPTGNTCGAVDPTNCVGQVNCELPANAGLVMCVTNKAPPSSTQGFNNGTNVVNNFGCVIAQSAGITNCNLKTNGVGYLLLAIALLLVNVLWLLAVHSFNQRGVVTPQPIFIHALLSFAVIAGFALIGWTDPTILIVAIVALVAFTAPKFIGMIRGGGIPAE